MNSENEEKDTGGVELGLVFQDQIHGKMVRLWFVDHLAEDDELLHATRHRSLVPLAACPPVKLFNGVPIFLLAA